MQASVYTKTGNKAPSVAKLSKTVFGVETKNHELLKSAYLAYLANGRVNLARTKTRGEVRGGGKKPWRQKGTGRARFGSIRVPIWRGGGITFGPTGLENYSKKLNTKAKRTAIRQALSMAASDDKIKVVDSLPSLEGKTKDVATFLKKVEAGKRTLAVRIDKLRLAEKALSNIQSVKLSTATHLNVYDIINADSIIIEQKALETIENWLGAKQSPTREAAKNE